MIAADSLLRELPCGCLAAPGGVIARHCPRHHPRFEPDITTANQLIAEWGLIAQSIARQCKWRLRGECLVSCQGLAVCNLEGLTLVDEQCQAVERP
jgi:hypothetical protein